MATPDDPSEVRTGARWHLSQALAHLEREELEDALRECRSAVAAAPRWAEAHRLLGVVLERSGAKMPAIHAYYRAVQFDPAFREPRESPFQTEEESRKATEAALGALVQHWKADGLQSKLKDDLA